MHVSAGQHTSRIQRAPVAHSRQPTAPLWSERLRTAQDTTKVDPKHQEGGPADLTTDEAQARIERLQSELEAAIQTHKAVRAASLPTLQPVQPGGFKASAAQTAARDTNVRA